jgi:hypothetical protein
MVNFMDELEGIIFHAVNLIELSFDFHVSIALHFLQVCAQGTEGNWN